MMLHVRAVKYRTSERLKNVKIIKNLISLKYYFILMTKTLMIITKDFAPF